MYRIIEGRGTGKTLRLMLLAKENNGVIVCSNPHAMRQKAIAYGLTGFDGRTIQPVIAQPRIANAQPATQIMIDTYMAALGFEKLNSTGRFSNSTYEVWDLLPRNVLIDCEGDIFVVDAEIKFIGK